MFGTGTEVGIARREWQEWETPDKCAEHIIPITTINHPANKQMQFHAQLRVQQITVVRSVALAGTFYSVNYWPPGERHLNDTLDAVPAIEPIND